MLAIRCVAAVVSVSVALATSPVLGAVLDDSCPCYGEERVLGGHTLIEPIFVESPLVITNTGVRSGVEFERIQNVDVGPSTSDIKQVRITGLYDLSLAWRNKLAVYVSLGGRAGVGADGDSLLLVGADYRLSGDLGGKLKLYRNDDGLLISMRAFGGYSRGTVYNLTSFALNVAAVDLPDLEDIFGDLGDLAEISASDIPKTLETDFWELRAGGDLSAAWVVTPVLALQASAGFRYTYQTYDVFVLSESSEEGADVDELRPRFGLALTADMAPLEVPVAGVVEYLFALPILDDDFKDIDTTTDEHLVALGLYYTGRTDMQVGVSGFVRLGLEPVLITKLESDEPQVFGGTFILRSYW